MEEKNMRELSMDEMETVSGGSSAVDFVHDLSRFIQRTVCNVIHYDGSSCLELRRVPGGAIISGIGWQNGEPILVHESHTEGGWYFAYKNGIYGYVNPNNVR